MSDSNRQYVELITDRAVERFLQRFFLRDEHFRTLCIVAPFISDMAEQRFSLIKLRNKIETEKIPTYVITNEPILPYQLKAIEIIRDSYWIEIRYNASLHAKLYVAYTQRENESFALFGFNNLTAKSIQSNIELGMLVYSIGPGRDLLHELYYWASVKLRTLKESRLIQPIRGKRR